MSNSTGSDAHAPCSEALARLAAGRLTDFTGLPGNCTRAQVVAVLGASRYDVDSTGPAGPFREYPASAAAPSGIVVFFETDGDAARYVRIDGAVIAGGIDPLGPPEATARSGLSSVAEQQIWASRGLTLHVNTIDGSIRRLYAYRPMTADEFLASDLARVEVRREPRRP